MLYTFEQQKRDNISGLCLTCKGIGKVWVEDRPQYGGHTGYIVCYECNGTGKDTYNNKRV